MDTILEFLNNTFNIVASSLAIVATIVTSVATLKSNKKENKIKLSKYQSDKMRKKLEIEKNIDLRYKYYSTEEGATDIIELLYDCSIFNNVSIKATTIIILSFKTKDPTEIYKTRTVEVPIEIYWYWHKRIIEENRIIMGEENNYSILYNRLLELNTPFKIIKLAKLDYVTKSGESSSQYYINGILQNKNKYNAIFEKYARPNMLGNVILGVDIRDLKKNHEKLLDYIQDFAKIKLIEETKQYIKNTPIIYKLIRKSHFKKVSKNLDKLNNGGYGYLKGLMKDSKIYLKI